MINLLEELVMNNRDFVTHLLVYHQPLVLWTGIVFALNFMILAKKKISNMINMA